MAGKKVLIVYAHQEPKSFNGSLLKIAVEELSKQGCSVTMSDLYAMQFEPRATRNDIVGHLHNSEAFNYGVETWEAYKRGGLSKDLVEEQKKVQEADLLIFQFPLFWFNMPAILKGWMDRVLVQGFAYDLSKVYDGGLLQVCFWNCFIKVKAYTMFYGGLFILFHCSCLELSLYTMLK
uniref:Flavodoxin-like fold domain-containing protein n=1 Tax=Geospiza parvula TaxID=87175 RepID=A0A8C3Q577_GEOPR